MSDDDAFEHLAAEAGAAIPVPTANERALSTVVGQAKRRRNRRRRLVAIAAVIPIALGVVWATTGRGHSQQVASVGPTTTLSLAQQICQELTKRSNDASIPVVYLDADDSDAQIAQVKAELSASPDITSLTYLDHAGSYAQAKKLFSNEPELLQQLTPQDLPTSFRLHLAGKLSDSVTGRLQSFIESLPGVYKVDGFPLSSDTVCPPPVDTSVSTTTFPPVPTTSGATSPESRSNESGTASLDATRKYLEKHLSTMAAACSKSADAYAKTHVGEPPPTTAASGTPEVNGMEAVVGPKCQTGYVPISGPDRLGGPGVDAPVRLTPSLAAPVVGYLVEGVPAWIPASDFSKYDPQTLVEAERELEAQPPPAGSVTRPPTS